MLVVCSKICAMLSSSASAKAGAMICRPTGRCPSVSSNPHGTLMAGRPVRLMFTVIRSPLYMASGSLDFCPSLYAALGATGLTKKSYLDRAPENSRCTKVRTCVKTRETSNLGPQICITLETTAICIHCELLEARKPSPAPEFRDPCCCQQRYLVQLPAQAHSNVHLPCNDNLLTYCFWNCTKPLPAVLLCSRHLCSLLTGHRYP